MKKYVWLAGISFFLGILLSGYVFLYLPEKKAAPAGFAENSASPSFSTPLFASSATEARPDLDFVKITDKVGPAVVKIESEKIERRRVAGVDEDWPFEDFWNRFFGQPRGREQEYRSMAQGTGFFISNDGYILTNNHIVENASKVSVFALQGEEYTAKVIGTDPKTDLALIKIEAKNQPFVELGDSGQLRVGEWVLAIGNPLGMEHTVTAGIVSAKGRQLGVGGNVPDYQDFIQTDAAINRGNSGGPLVNMKGEVIGITSNILSPTGGNIGIGFAIPSSLAKKVVVQLKEKGKVVRGYLGIRPDNITEDLMKLLNLKDKKGAVVVTVEPGTPADKAGLKQYDVIIEISGQKVENPNDLRFKIADIQPGKKVELKVIRDGKERLITTVVEEMEPEGERRAPEENEKNIGISVTAMTPSLARRYGYRTTDGLLVTQVQRYSEAQRKGVEVGDIVLEINRKKATSAEDLTDALKKTRSGEAVVLLVRREKDGQVQDFIVSIRIP